MNAKGLAFQLRVLGPLKPIQVAPSPFQSAGGRMMDHVALGEGVIRV